MKQIVLKPIDLLILLSAIFFTLWLYNIFWFNTPTSGHADYLVVDVSDNPTIRYDLDKDRQLKIQGTIGESIIEIKARQARFIHSPCRNQFCVLHGWVSHNGDITACLPNQMSISLQTKHAENEQHFDALSGAQ